MDKPEDYVSFGDVARQQMGQQCQYAVRFFNPAFHEHYAYLGEGLRIKLDESNYHGTKIHRDDVVEAVKRYRECPTK